MILFLNSGREKKTRHQSLPVICKHVQYKYRGRGGDVTNMRDWGSSLWEGWASDLPGEGAAAATFVLPLPRWIWASSFWRKRFRSSALLNAETSRWWVKGRGLGVPLILPVCPDISVPAPIVTEEKWILAQVLFLWSQGETSEPAFHFSADICGERLRKGKP